MIKNRPSGRFFAYVMWYCKFQFIDLFYRRAGVREIVLAIWLQYVIMKMKYCLISQADSDKLLGKDEILRELRKGK